MVTKLLGYPSRGILENSEGERQPPAGAIDSRAVAMVTGNRPFCKHRWSIGLFTNVELLLSFSVCRHAAEHGA